MNLIEIQKDFNDYADSAEKTILDLYKKIDILQKKINKKKVKKMNIKVTLTKEDLLRAAQEKLDTMIKPEIETKSTTMAYSEVDEVFYFEYRIGADNES